jgi:multidrug efflux pump
MNFSRAFILRPIGTSLLALGVLLAGWLGYRALPLSTLPAVDFPSVQVTVEWPGASAETMEVGVTSPLEYQFGRISSLKSLVSSSSPGLSAITLTFDLDRDIDAATQDIQAAINAASGHLPKAMPNAPVYRKVNPADTPVMVLALTSTSLAMGRLGDLVDTMVAQKLSQLSGVGLVLVEGGQKPAVRIQADPAKLANLGIDLATVRAVLIATSVNQPKGTLDGERQAFSVGVNDQLHSAAEFADTIIAYKSGAPVRLGDVATVVDGVENRRSGAWSNGEPAILVDIYRQPGANIIETADLVRAQVPQLARQLPPSVALSVLIDRTTPIRASLKDVQFTLTLTVALVVMVMFLFLRKLWATVIPSIVLPVSIIGTFGTMHLLGFSLNNLSLMALTIATGFIVDDAIVMIENIVRHLEEGEDPLTAALKGARQIGFTIVSLTVSLVAVFIPLLFMSGVLGRLFREFAVTLTISIVISALVSLTLTPMMCARLLRPPREGQREAWILRLFEHAFQATLGAYRRSLDVVLRHQGLTLLVTLATLAGTVWLYVAVPKGFLPQQDTGILIGVTEAAPDISYPAMAERQKAVAERVRGDPAVVAVGSFVGAGTVNPTGNTGRLYIVLKPRDERDGLTAVMDRLRERARGVSGLALFLQPVQDLQIETRVGRAQYQYTLQHPDAATLDQWTGKMLAALSASPLLQDVGSDATMRGLRAKIDVDRERAGRLGVTMEAIDNALYDAFGQRQILTVYSQSNQYRVILEADPAVYDDPSALEAIHVKTASGKQARLGSIATVTIEPAPLSIGHLSQFRSATVSFNLAPGVSMGEGVAAIDAAEREIGLPPAVLTGFSGAAQEFRSSLDSQVYLVIAAVIVVYIVLGVLYESYIHPITILSTLPSAGIGALLALIAFGHDLSVISVIGLVLLIGVVKKNAIMMVDFAIEAQRGEGKPPLEAIREACLIRFRPIMMTTMAALLGAVPLAFESGVGSEFRQPLGVAILGGLLVSQFLTLYTTPVIFLFMDRFGQFLRRFAPSRLAAAERAD